MKRAVEQLGFVQADPIRAPARAQDLTLRHRVKNYHAGDLERRYAQSGIEEDFFINYGFMPRETYLLMHPRIVRRTRTALSRKRAHAVLDFVREKGRVHPRDVDAYFQHGTVQNYWGGASSATTHLLDDLHYRGMLRVVRRDSGVRVYALEARESTQKLDPLARRARVDRLVDVVVGTYAPVPEPTLGPLIGRLRFAVPQWRGELKAAIGRAKKRLARADLFGVNWYWPTAEDPRSSSYGEPQQVRFLAPFDPVVWDRKRFERFWSWPYRFEAYTPPRQRKLGYYALPILWRDRAIGWANVTWKASKLDTSFGFVDGRPKGAAFERELEAEIERLREFLV